MSIEHRSSNIAYPHPLSMTYATIYTARISTFTIITPLTLVNGCLVKLAL